MQRSRNSSECQGTGRGVNGLLEVLIVLPLIVALMCLAMVVIAAFLDAYVRIKSKTKEFTEEKEAQSE